MPTLQIEDLLAQAESELCCLERDEAEVLWSAVRTGKPPAAGNFEGRRSGLLSDEHVLFRLENVYRSASGVTPLRRRSELWLSLALRQQAAAESGQRRQLRQVQALMDSYRGQVGRERLGVDQLRMTLTGDSDRSRREQAYRALLGLAQALSPLHRDILELIRRAWTPDRAGKGTQAKTKAQTQAGTDASTPYWRQPLAPFTLDWGGVDLPSMAESLLSGTDDLIQRFGHLGARTLGIRSLRPWDLDYAVLRLSRGYDAYFPASEAAAGIVRGMRACGLRIDSLPLIPELRPKWSPLERRGLPQVDWAVLAVPGQGDRRTDAPVTARARVRPQTVVIADYAAGAQHGWMQLAQATGVALGVLYGRAGFLAERSLPPRIDPAALIVADLATEPNWLAGQTELPRSDIPRFLTMGCLRSGLLQAVILRQMAARAQLAWEAMAQDGGNTTATATTATTATAAGLLARAGGLAEADGVFSALDLVTLDEPAYWPSMFLSELAAAQVRGFLRREHGRLMGDRRTGELLVECFWRAGRMIPITQSIRTATGASLDVGHAIEQLAVAAAL